VVHLPQLLNTTPANVNLPATTGADHVNNIEQVVIDNPAAGTYTLSVTGTTIPFGGQHEYFLAFDPIPVSTELTYPIGGEGYRMETPFILHGNHMAILLMISLCNIQLIMDHGLIL
jgi:hypothetical protein